MNKRKNILSSAKKALSKEISSINWHDNYPNQTYWITINSYSIHKNSLLPEWLNIAVGFGLDDSLTQLCLVKTNYL